MRPSIVIGVPLFNKAGFLPESLESILAQTYGDFKVVIIDDASRDDSADVAMRYASIDPRITVRRNKHRRGMIGNWAGCYRVARDLAPDLDYFAWGSDHDLWHPAWLATLVKHLESHPEAVLAYPLNLRISDSGEVLREPWYFETRGLTDVDERLATAIRGMSAGNMVYGLFRARALERAGVFQRYLLPDRLVLTRLALYGEFHQIDRLLWYRRFSGLMSLGRQRRSFFPGGSPLYSYLPWWLTHTLAMVIGLLFRRHADETIGVLTAIRLAWTHLRESAALEFGRKYRYSRKWIALRIKNLRHVKLRRVRNVVRRVGGKLRRARNKVYLATLPFREIVRNRLSQRARQLP